MHSPKSSHGGFSLFVSSIALIVAFIALIAVAFKLESNGPAEAKGHSSLAAEDPTAAPEEVSLAIKSDEEHARKGPDGTWHDAYLPAEFTVEPGATVRVVVHNYDEAQHTFTAPGIGVEQMIAAGSEASPATTTFTFEAPRKPGRYDWHCMMPCDPWAMNHVGYMKGVVTVA